MTPSFDPSKKFIRIVERRGDGLVEFEFAVGEPELFVEMLLPPAEFAEFCAMHGLAPAQPLPAAAALPSQEQGWDWTLRAARAQRLQH